MSRELTVLQPLTLRRVRRLFESPAAAGAFAAEEQQQQQQGEQQQGQQQQQEQRWEVAAASVDAASGACSACGGRLAAVDLDPGEFRAFGRGIADLAAKQEKHPNDFAQARACVRACEGGVGGSQGESGGGGACLTLQTPPPPPPLMHHRQFMAWLEANGPFGVVVDAANVAFFGQNHATGGFSFAQIRWGAWVGVGGRMARGGGGRGERASTGRAEQGCATSPPHPPTHIRYPPT